MAIPHDPDKKKSALRILVTLIALLLVVTALLYYNNRRYLSVVDYSTVKRPEAAAADTPKPPLAPPSGPRPLRLRASEAGLNFAIGPVVCATADTARHCLQVGVRLMFTGAALEKEISGKRENIERLIKFVFSGKQLAQINAESARAELLGKINAFLTAGRADDLIFTAFDIIPMEMK